MTKEDDEQFEDSCWVNVGSVMIVMLIMILKEEIIIISLENSEALRIEIEISTLNQIITFLLYSTTQRIMSHILLCRNWGNEILK